MACFIIIRHKFIISKHMVLLLGTCSSLLGTSSSLLGTCPTSLGTSPSLSHTTSLSSSPSFTIRHPFIIRYWLNFLGHASFISTFLKYLREEHCFYPPKMFLPTIYVKSHSGFCSISSVILWDTFVLAIVLRSIDLIQSILTVVVPTKEAAIEIELVN